MGSISLFLVLTSSISQESTDARTNSIMVVNVGNKEGKIKMVSFMRDTLVNIKGPPRNRLFSGLETQYGLQYW